MATTLGALNPFRYRGYVYDEETSLYYLRSRYYNPNWGRFINADSVLGKPGQLLGHNVFAYCRNNPVSYSDPSGHSQISDLQNGFPGYCFSTEQYFIDTMAFALNQSKVRVRFQNGQTSLYDIVIGVRVPNIGPPNTQFEWYDKSGELHIRWYGDDGYAVKDRHFSDHGYPKDHDNPHDEYWGFDEKGNWTLKPSKKSNDVDSSSIDTLVETAFGLAAAYYVFKWAMAIIAAPETCGASLVVALCTP